MLQWELAKKCPTSLCLIEALSKCCADMIQCHPPHPALLLEACQD